MPPRLDSPSLRLLVAAGAGLLLSTAFEPIAFFWSALPAVALLLWAVRDQSARRGALLGLAFGVCFMYPNIYWMRAVADAAWLALAGVEALFLSLGGACLAVVSRWRAWPLWSTLVWVGIEVARGSWPFSGFTWGRLSFAVVDTPFAAPLPWIGSNGVSLLVAGTAALLAWWALAPRPRVRPALIGLGALIVALAVPAVLGPRWTTERTATLALVQGDVPGDGTELVENHREVTRSHVTLTEQLGEAVRRGEESRPDLVVWPENSTAVDPFQDAATREGIDRAVAAIDAPVLVGAMVDHEDPDKILNEGIVEDPIHGNAERYAKRHPVPFGEYIPFRHLLPKDSNIGRLAEVPRDMVAGDRRTPLQVRGLRVADAICFDVSYDDVFVDQVRRGAQVVVVQTSNAMFIKTAQIDQQFAITRLRALETGRTVAVAAVNGRTGVIGPDGQVVADLPPRTKGVVTAEVKLAAGTPPALWIGPWLGRASVIVSAAALALAGLAYRRRREQGGEGSST
ncbi:apolipoprotein N-acyltransferase [Nocardioides daejeonensis]|uniref:apolipoprotein N-acyltransferase n=1 Tax=Nocardioides daejeonensis TaxID=1046556 RepID=UPI0013A5569C|nr:apolipoprotein N-acyltransferase [Nocardioides daejeonensis]